MRIQYYDNFIERVRCKLSTVLSVPPGFMILLISVVCHTCWNSCNDIHTFPPHRHSALTLNAIPGNLKYVFVHCDAQNLSVCYILQSTSGYNILKIVLVLPSCALYLFHNRVRVSRVQTVFCLCSFVCTHFLSWLIKETSPWKIKSFLRLLKSETSVKVFRDSYKCNSSQWPSKYLENDDDDFYVFALILTTHNKLKT